MGRCAQVHCAFLSTPSARRATRTALRASLVYLIFLSTPSARRATETYCGTHKDFPFLSTPSARRATSSRAEDAAPLGHFYPRPPRGGRPNGLFFLATPTNFYPRPPRGGRQRTTPSRWTRPLFLSTPSARRATYGRVQCENTGRFLSTPSARRATAALWPVRLCWKYFYPRPPRGGRRAGAALH